MEDKFEKRTNCEYCDKILDAKYRNKRFCNDKCRIYWNREQKLEKVLEDLTDKNKEAIEETLLDIMEQGVAITKSDENGNMERVDPNSEEGQKVIDMAAELPKEETVVEKMLRENREKFSKQYKTK